MSDDQTGPIEPEAPAPPAYAMPVPPAYAPRPRFADQVMGMRAVVATALACLIVGGLGGFVLGRATGDDNGRFVGPRGGFFQQRGTFPNGPSGQNAFPYGSHQFPNAPFGPGQMPSPNTKQHPSPNGG